MSTLVIVWGPPYKIDILHINNILHKKTRSENISH
jgi:hypothetical protein